MKHWMRIGVLLVVICLYIIALTILAASGVPLWICLVLSFATPALITLPFSRRSYPRAQYDRFTLEEYRRLERDVLDGLHEQQRARRQRTAHESDTPGE